MQQLRARGAPVDDQQPYRPVVEFGVGGEEAVLPEMSLVGSVHHHEPALHALPRRRQRLREAGQLAAGAVHSGFVGVAAGVVTAAPAVRRRLVGAAGRREVGAASGGGAVPRI
mgnify:CR=1 FL=1